MRALRRPFVVALLGIVGGLGVVTVRLLVDAGHAYHEGLAAEQRGETTLAIRHYLDAGRLYVPFAPSVRHAMDQLDAIGVTSVKSGDYGTARAAFEAERSAILATRSFYTPFASRLPSIEGRLARLLATAESRATLDTFEERSRWHAQRLAERPHPKTSLVLLALLGLGMWTGAAVAFFRRGITKTLAIDRVPAILASVAFAVGLGLFLVCLRLA